MEEILECPVCTERFDRNRRLPLVLLCGHTLCKNCASEMQEGEEGLRCPLDKQPDSRNLAQISHSYHILELIEHVTSMIHTIKYLKLTPQERLEAMQRQARENCELLETHVNSIQKKIKEIQNKKTCAMSEISEDFVKLKALLSSREEELAAEVSDIADDYLAQFTTVEESIVAKLLEARETEEQVKHAEEITDAHPDIQPITNLPELPTGELRIKFVCDTENAVKYIENIGKVGKWSVKIPHECDHFKNVTYWMVPPCCYQYYCCNKCHDSNEQHAWVYANRMVCMYCEKEQDYRKLPNSCEHCNVYHKGVVSK